MIDFLWYHESHPPLFYFLMRAWQGVFGDSEATALALPILFGVTLIPVTYWVGQRVFSHATGLIAAALATTSPLMVGCSAVVRPYSLLPLLCLLSVFFLWSGLKGRDVKFWVGHIAATLAMLLTHNWAWMVLGAEWIVAVAYLMPRHKVTDWPLVRSWFFSQTAVLIGFAPWSPIFLYQLRNAGYDAFPRPASEVLALFSETVLSIPRQVAIPTCLLLVVMGGWHAVRRRGKLDWNVLRSRSDFICFMGVPFLAFGLAALLSLKKFMLFSQCLTTIVPCFLLAMAFGVATWSSMPRVVAVLVSSIYLVFSVSDLRDIKSNAREVAATVASQAKPTDFILITPVWLASSFNYYFVPDNPQSNYPHEERRGPIDYDNLRDRLLDSGAMARVREHLAQASREQRRVWLVTGAEILPEKVSESDRLPDSLPLQTYGHVGRIRAIQLRRLLDQLYGPPTKVAVPKEGRDGLEIMQVLLYARDGSSLQTADPRGGSASTHPAQQEY
jgi:hypothetical protein